jgi:class 3 adenylate cyclase
MSTDPEDSTKKGDKNYDEDWRLTFVEGNPDLKGLQEDFMRMRGEKRCTLCKVPFDFDGPLPGREPSVRNPNFCGFCDIWIVKHHPGGVVGTFPIIAADLRGSVALAETMDSDVYQRRYEDPFLIAATQALIDTDGFIAETRGDELRGVYPRGFCGADYLRKVVEGARHLLQDISPKTPEGTPIPFGIGVHIGNIVIGTQPRAGGPFQRIAITGDGVNTCSRICDEAGPGEALISEPVCKEIGFPIDRLESRLLNLKGKKEPLLVYVITAQSGIDPYVARPS